MTIYDEIRAVKEAATPGPWGPGPWGKVRGDDWSIDNENGELTAIFIGTGPNNPVAVAVVDSASEKDHIVEANAQLIALTPTLADMALRLEAADQMAEALVAALEAFEEIEDYKTGRRAILPCVKYRKQFASEALAAYRQKEGG